jgi:spermidine synthase
MEQRTNSTFVNRANGDVFIAGLGIGLIVLPIQEKEEVKSITILEKHPEVIELVGKQLPLNEKVKIIQGDVFEYEFARGTKFDTIYFDIWNYVNEDVYEEMKTLKKKYRKYRRSTTENPNFYMACWAEYEAKTGRRLM